MQTITLSLTIAQAIKIANLLSWSAAERSDTECPDAQDDAALAAHIASVAGFDIEQMRECIRILRATKY